MTILSLDDCPIWFTAPKLQDFLACVQPGEPSLPASARTYATRARLHLGRSSDRDTTKLLSETRYEPLNRFALATEKHFPRSFTRPTLGGDLNSYALAFYFPKIAAIIVGKHITELLVASSLFNLAGAIGGVAAVLLVVKYGTRRLTQVGFLVVGGMLLIMGLLGPSGMPAILGACMLIFIAFHIMGPGGMTMVVGTMSYPAEVRATGAGLTEAAVRCGSVVGFFVFPILLASVGLANTALILLACPIVGILATLVFRWEMLGYDADASVNIAEDLGGGATQPVK